MVSAKATPLCPAGHLPLKGGDWLAFVSRTLLRGGASRHRLISPLEGEMPGKAEGGELGTTHLHESAPC
ncbi:putative lytic murein transglycosylase [Nitratireductor basaltis]|uniref:Putative lytic murein transglycosylase n=1 Tax=Nitratireductor basaltis TaxID=472175 RepID=A0A084U6M0_9HYPH|nr:putative lytic murein transglycosylase [Nitratireductor basaltis]